MSWQPCLSPTCDRHSGRLEMVIEPQAKNLGGFEVRRVLPSPDRQMVGPFIFFDEVGPGPGSSPEVA